MLNRTHATIATSLALAAGAASAQTATQTFNLGDLTTVGADQSFSYGLANATYDTLQTDMTRDYVAWRVRTDWSAAAGDPYSIESTVRLGGLASAGALNAAFDGTSVPGLTFAGLFPEGGPASLSGYDLQVSSGLYGNANFDNTTLEWFARDELPLTLVGGGERAGQIPAVDVDLGVVADEGGQLHINAFGSNLDPAIAIYAADGELVDLTSLITIHADTPSLDLSPTPLIDDAGNISMRTLARGEYFAVITEWDGRFDHGFDITPRLEQGDQFTTALSINGVGGSHPIGFGGDEIGVYRFEIVPAPATIGVLSLAGLAATRRRR